MQLSRWTPLVPIALLMVSPLAGAWSMMGQQEPSTSYDATQGWMFTDTDTQACTQSGCDTNRVYFNAFHSSNVDGFNGGLAGGAQGNPNSAIAGTSITGPEYENYAMLGVWKDCNNDGFVGLGDQGLFEYRSEILANYPGTGDSICPPSPVPSPIPAGWTPPHNDGQWVHEFLPIGWDAYSGNQNPWKISDEGARVWYDNGLPNGGTAQMSCWTNPPTGSLHSTGGLLYWGDCDDNYAITDSIDTVAATNPALSSLSFSDASRNQYQSNSALNKANPWGGESDASDVQAWDCSQPQLVQEEVTSPVSAVNATVFANVSAPMVPPGTSVPTDPAGHGLGLGGTANATVAGTDQCSRRTDEIGGGRGGTAANAPYAAEAAVAQSATKANNDGVLSGVDTAHRGSTCALEQVSQPATYDLAGDQCEVTVLGQHTGVSTDLGSNPTGPGTPAGYGQKFTTLDGVWWNFVSVTNKFFGQTRLQTFYAYVSPTAVSHYHLNLPHGATNGVYGAEWCGSFTSGAHNGWNCDPAQWWLDSTGKDISPRSPYLGKDPSLTGPCTPDASVNGAQATGATSRGCYEVAAYPGAVFNLRDVLCSDDSVAPVRDAVGPIPLAALGDTADGCNV